MKRILLFTLVVLTLGMPVCTYAQAEKDGVESEVAANASLNVSGNDVRVTGASGAQLEVYNLAGVRIKTINIDSADKSLTLNLPKGCYILKVGKVVRKVSIR